MQKYFYFYFSTFYFFPRFFGNVTFSHLSHQLHKQDIFHRLCTYMHFFPNIILSFTGFLVRAPIPVGRKLEWKIGKKPINFKSKST